LGKRRTYPFADAYTYTDSNGRAYAYTYADDYTDNVRV
jgi:hypothetical protein